MTEIAIVLYNGKEVEGKYETLINPHQQIPPFIANMTGISDAMVAVAPSFEEVAPKIYNLLKDRVFVAHNVNFDFSFVKHHLQRAGLNLQSPKLCTIRLSRKVFPGFRKYGLGHLCRELGVTIENRHRAGGDALATTEVLALALQKNGMAVINEMLKKDDKHQLLPPNLAEEQIKHLPTGPGVYYFHDNKGKVIYVGKAKNLYKRVVSHFTGWTSPKSGRIFCGTSIPSAIMYAPQNLSPAYLKALKLKGYGPFIIRARKGTSSYGGSIFLRIQGATSGWPSTKNKNTSLQ